MSKDISTISDINEAAANFYNLRLDRGRSLNDIERNAVLAVTWEVPVGRGKSLLTSGVLSKILGNWTASSIVSARGGFPFSVQASGDVCNCSLSGDERAQQVGDPWSGFSQSRSKWFNTTAFVQPSQGTLGNSGQHILSGPGAVNADFTVYRMMRLRERANFQVRAEFYNMFNHVNFGNPNATVGTANYGIITSAAAGRVIQFAMKFQF